LGKSRKTAPRSIGRKRKNRRDLKGKKVGSSTPVASPKKKKRRQKTPCRKDHISRTKGLMKGREERPKKKETKLKERTNIYP